MFVLNPYSAPTAKMSDLQSAVSSLISDSKVKFSDAEGDLLKIWCNDDNVARYNHAIESSISIKISSIIRAANSILSTFDDLMMKKDIFEVCSYVTFMSYSGSGLDPYSSEFIKSYEKRSSEVYGDARESIACGIQKWNTDFIIESRAKAIDAVKLLNENKEDFVRLKNDFAKIESGADEVKNIYNSIQDVKAHYAISKLSVDFKGLLNGLERKAIFQGLSAVFIAVIVFTLLLTKIFIQFDFVDLHMTKLPCMPNGGGWFWSIVSLVHNNITKVSNIATEVAVIIILVYFFRILMSQYNATNEQIVEYRHIASVCDFTSSYVPFLKENELSSDDALQKFNNYIFATRSKPNPQLPEAIWCGLVPGTVNPNGNAGNKADQS